MVKMNYKKHSLASKVASLALVWLILPGQAMAISTPSFPSCANPGGKLIVSYDTGIHGVPGRTESYNGRDKVYLLEDGNTLQCLCTVNGDGVHTNWWKTNSLTEDEINSLKASGWIFIPDGSIWGLEKTTYMAQNVNFSCNGNSNGGGSTSSTSSNNSSSGQVQGIATRFGQVLGLATTGTLPVIATYFFSGLFLLLVSRLLKK
jgi:hypothetical protein